MYPQIISPQASIPKSTYKFENIDIAPALVYLF